MYNVRGTREKVTSYESLFFAPKGQHNLVQGNALGKYRTILYAPCKGSIIVFIALPPQGFVGRGTPRPSTIDICVSRLARRIDVDDRYNAFPR